MRQLVEKGTQEATKFSDADTCTSSEYSSSDDDFHNSVEQISLDNSLPTQVTSDESDILPHESCERKGVAAAKKTEAELESSSSKRRKL